MILIIIIISLGKLLLSYIANTSRTHAHTRLNAHARTHSLTPPPTTVAVRCVGVPNHDAESWLGAGETMSDRRFIRINKARATQYSR